MNITKTIKKLEYLKSKYGDIDIVEIFYGNPDYPRITIEPINPTVVSNPLDEKVKVIIFD
jgi:hypothetical protein